MDRIKRESVNISIVAFVNIKKNVDLFILNIYVKNTWKTKSVTKIIVLTDILKAVNGYLARVGAKDKVVNTSMLLWLTMMKVKIVNKTLSVLVAKVFGLKEIV